MSSLKAGSARDARRQVRHSEIGKEYPVCKRKVNEEIPVTIEKIVTVSKKKPSYLLINDLAKNDLLIK